MVTAAWLVIPTGLHLGVRAAGHAGAHSVLDGDSLDGGSLTQGDGLLVLQALIRRSAAIYGVDLEPLR